MKTWPAVLALVALSFLLAGSLVSSVGSSAGSRTPGPTLTIATPGPTDQATIATSTIGGHSQPLETPALAHRQRVLQGFACSDCHGVERGWLMPADHADMGLGECRDCHRAVPEPAPIALHTTMDQDLSQEPCGRCHSNLVALPLSVPTKPTRCASCHGSEVDQVLPISHAGRAQFTSTCIVCHETTLLAVPVVPHKLNGRERCTFCHGPQRLTPLTGAHKRAGDAQCLQCHAAVQHLPNTNTNMHELSKQQGGCLSCHAEGRLAPLPGSHAGRAEVLCVLCHTIAHEGPPSGPHALTGQAACNTCHVPQDVGALPASHAARTDQMCVSCHMEDTAPAIPHALEKRGNCEDCHVPSSRLSLGASQRAP